MNKRNKKEYKICLVHQDWRRFTRALHRTLDKIHAHPEGIISRADLRNLDDFLYKLDYTFYQGKLVELED